MLLTVTFNNVMKGEFSKTIKNPFWYLNFTNFNLVYSDATLLQKIQSVILFGYVKPKRS